MSDEEQLANPENQIGQADPSEKHKKPLMRSEKIRRFATQHLKEHRQNKRRERRFEFNWFSWFFDEFPSEEIYRPPLGERRNTRQEMTYHRFRQRTSWSFWSRMKSSTGIKLAAVGGLVAAFLQAAPLLKGAEAAVGPLGWLLVGGGFYLLAVIWFEARCPVLLKRTLAGKDEYLGIEGRRWLLALAEDELRRWWSVQPYRHGLTRFDPDCNQQMIARIMSRDGHIPAFGGFSNYASARIEHALQEYAQLTSTTIWREDHCRQGLCEFAPQTIWSSANKPLRSLHLNVLTAGEVQAAEAGKEGDLVVRWFDTSLDFLPRLSTRRNLMISAYAEGFIYLFRTDASALTFTRILAQWQNTMRPLSRLVLISLFLASGACFVWFVFLQLKILLPSLI